MTDAEVQQGFHEAVLSVFRTPSLRFEVSSPMARMDTLAWCDFIKKEGDLLSSIVTRLGGDRLLRLRTLHHFMEGAA